MSRAEILRHRPLRALLAAEVISTTGAQMTWLALPWFVLTTTGSPAPDDARDDGRARRLRRSRASRPGRFVQRMGARRSMLIADAAPRAADAARAGAPLDRAPVAGGAARPRVPARRARRAVLHGPEGDPSRSSSARTSETISQANALFQGAIRATMLLGPPLGGVLIGLIGAANVLVVDAATYVVSFLLVGAFVPRRGRNAGAGRGAAGSSSGCASWFTSSLLRVWIPLFVAGDAAWQAFFAAVPVLVDRALRRRRDDRRPALRGLRRRRADRELPLVPLLRSEVDGLLLVALTVPSAGGSALDPDPRRRRAGHVRRDPRQRDRERHLQSVDPHDLHAPHAGRDPRRRRCPPAARSGARACRSASLVAGPVLAAFGTRPVLVGFAAVQTRRHARRRRRVPERTCGRAVAATLRSTSSLERLELVRLCGQRGEAAWRKSFAAAAPSDQVSRRPKRGAMICVPRDPRRPRCRRSASRSRARRLPAPCRRGTGSSSSPIARVSLARTARE